MRALVAGALAAGLLSGCGATASLPKATPSTSVDAGPLIRVMKDPKYNMEALLTGRLRLAQGCLVLDMGRIGDQLIVWPTYVVWNSTARAVESADGKVEVPIGTRLRMGGGTVNLTSMSYALAPDEMQRLRGCSERTGIRAIAKIEPFAKAES